MLSDYEEIVAESLEDGMWAQYDYGDLTSVHDDIAHARPRRTSEELETQGAALS